MLQLFFGFSGRIPRITFTFGLLFLMMIKGLLTSSLLPLFEITAETYTNRDSILYLVIYTITEALILWPLLALGYKRMHDLELPGKYFGYACLSYLIVNFIGSLGILSNPMQNLWFLIFLYASLSYRSCIILYLIFKSGQGQWHPEKNLYKARVTLHSEN